MNLENKKIRINIDRVLSEINHRLATMDTIETLALWCNDRNYKTTPVSIQIGCDTTKNFKTYQDALNYSHAFLDALEFVGIGE